MTDAHDFAKDEGTEPFPDYVEPVLETTNFSNFYLPGPLLTHEQIVLWQEHQENVVPAVNVHPPSPALTEISEGEDLAQLLPHERTLPVVSFDEVTAREVEQPVYEGSPSEKLEIALLHIYEDIFSQRIIDKTFAPALTEVVDPQPAQIVPESIELTENWTFENQSALLEASTVLVRPRTPSTSASSDQNRLRTLSKVSSSTVRSQARSNITPVHKPLQIANTLYGTPLDPTARTDDDGKSREKEREIFSMLMLTANSGNKPPDKSLLETLEYRPCDFYNAVHFARDIILARTRAINGVVASSEALKWADALQKVYSNERLWWDLVWDIKDERAREKFVDCLAEVRESWRWASEAVGEVRKEVLLRK